MNKNDSNKALVVLSGGQDSTTCLYWAIDRFGADAVDSVTFDYGQRHRVELECATAVADFAGIGNTCLPIDTFAALGGDALTDTDIDVENGIAKRQTASVYLKQLCDIGVLREVKSGRETIFVHPKYIELLTGEENVWVYYAGVETDSPDGNTEPA